ncbi:MAG: aldose 1-epimerase family protein [Acidimicrobiales bacterium]
MTAADPGSPRGGEAFEPPSGRQVELVRGDQSAFVVEVGGALRSYTVAGRPLLDGYGPGERCTGARGHPLIPWPNRLRGGTYSFADREHQLSLTEPERGNAIHGLVRWASWCQGESSGSRVVMTHTLHPQPGWPFTLGLSIDYSLGDGGLTVRVTAANLGADPCPYGAGAHPYLALGAGGIDDLWLKAPGGRFMRSDERGIPTGEEGVGGTPYDFRVSRRIGSAVIDTAYTALQRDPDGRARVELADPATGRGVSLWQDEAYPYLMLYTGDSLPEEERRRQGLGVEPMTCAPNALSSGEGLQVLAPGQSFTSCWGISPAASAG